jgi:hypothetical protein
VALQEDSSGRARREANNLFFMKNLSFPWAVNGKIIRFSLSVFYFASGIFFSSCIIETSEGTGYG